MTVVMGECQVAGGNDRWPSGWEELILEVFSPVLLLRPFNGSHITKPRSAFSKDSVLMMGTILWPE